MNIAVPEDNLSAEGASSLYGTKSGFQFGGMISRRDWKERVDLILKKIIAKLTIDFGLV